MKASPKPKISVVMAVHNGMPYLKDAVASILNQTCKNFEFIVIDDGSTDKSWSFLNGLKDKRLKLIKNKKNLGLAKSLNAGLEAAKGQYIARMDADDISLPKRLETQLKFLENNPQVDLCGTWVKHVDENGKELSILKKPADDKSIKKANRWVPGIVHPTWFAKKDVFKKLNYDPEYEMIEDLEFLNRAKSLIMANINESLLLWRVSQNRRSKKDIEKMYKKTLNLRLRYFLKGKFPLTYAPFILRSLITTYLLPSR